MSLAPISCMPVLHALRQPLRSILSTSSFATSAYTLSSYSPSSSMSVTATSTVCFPQCCASPAGRVKFVSEASTPSRHVSSTPQMLLTALPTVSESPEVTVSSFINMSHRSVCGVYTSYFYSLLYTINLRLYLTV